MWNSQLFFHATQPSSTVSRGDTFDELEEASEATTPQAETTVAPSLSTLAATRPTPTSTYTTPPPYSPPSTSDPSVDPDAAPCSGRPFDAFLQLKNTSIYAFRGKYWVDKRQNKLKKILSWERKKLPTQINEELASSPKGNTFSSWITSPSSPDILN